MIFAASLSKRYSPGFLFKHVADICHPRPQFVRIGGGRRLQRIAVNGPRLCLEQHPAWTDQLAERRRCVNLKATVTAPIIHLHLVPLKLFAPV